MKGCEETKMDVINRMAKTLYELEEKYEGKTILLVTHKSPMACIEIYNSGNLYERGTGNTPVFSNPANGEILELDFRPMPHDKTGAVNFHLPYITDLNVYDLEGNLMKKEGGVFDCWYESGSMPYAQLHYPFENTDLFQKHFPADFIVEAQDQTRGWFYTMLVLGVGLFDQTPFKSAICTGMINAADGKKMSKKLKNYTDPVELVNKFGSDSMRYYVLSSTAIKGESIKFSDEGIKMIASKNVGRLLNVLEFYKTFSERSVGDTSSVHVLDKYILARLKEVKYQVSKGLDELFLDVAFRPVEKFIDDLSVWYLRRSRDRFKSEDDSVRREALQTTKYVLQSFARILAPIMPFTAEVLWQDLRSDIEPLSVHLSNWGQVEQIDAEDLKVIEDMEATRAAVSKILDQRTKIGIKVRQPLQKVTFKNNLNLSENHLFEIKEETNLKEILFDENQAEEIVLDTDISDELKEEGTYRELVRAIQDKRKEWNLQVSDQIDITLPKMGELEMSVIEKYKQDLQKECGLKSITFSESSGGYEYKLN